MLVGGQALAGQRTLVDGRDAGRDRAVDGHAFAGTDGHGLACGDVANGNVDLATAADDMRHRGTKIEDAANGRLGSIERIALDAFTAERDEDHERGRHVLAKHDCRQSGDRQGQFRADAPLKEPVERLIEDSPAAEHRRQEGQPKTERRPVSGPRRVAEQADQQVCRQESPDDQRQEIDGRGLIVKARGGKSAAGLSRTRSRGRAVGQKVAGRIGNVVHDERVVAGRRASRGNFGTDARIRGSARLQPSDAGTSS